MVLYPNKLPESERVCSGICILQKAVIRCMEVGLEDVTEESVLELLRLQFNTIRCYAKKSSYTMNSKLASLEVQNEEGEYIIPAELYAISKETE